jgi:hypothetical protein
VVPEVCKRKCLKYSVMHSMDPKPESTTVFKKIGVLLPLQPQICTNSTDARVANCTMLNVRR